MEFKCRIITIVILGETNCIYKPSLVVTNSMDNNKVFHKFYKNNRLVNKLINILPNTHKNGRNTY